MARLTAKIIILFNYAANNVHYDYKTIPIIYF